MQCDKAIVKYELEFRRLYKMYEKETSNQIDIDQDHLYASTASTKFYKFAATALELLQVIYAPLPFLLYEFYTFDEAKCKL